MVDNWNSVVTPQDKVYHLGDVYMGGGFTREDTVKLLSSLNGKKRLILGNHDNGKDQILQQLFQKIDVWRMFPEFGLLLTHVPVHWSALVKSGRNGQPSFQLANVHGHTHNRLVEHFELELGVDTQYKNVCVEHTDYRPVNIEELRVT